MEAGYSMLCVLLLDSVIAFCYGRMNVLFLVADDLRPELMSYYGKDYPSKVHPPIHSPNLDTLAAKSLLLKRAYVQQAVCAPSRTSLLTGRRPDTTHVYDLKAYWRDVGGNFTTIPQYFKQNGYISAGMGKIFHPGPSSADDDPSSWSMPYFHAPSSAFWEPWPPVGSSWKAVSDAEMKKNPLPDEQIADYAISTMHQLAPGAKSGNQPFFLAVGFRKPHLPFIFPKSMLSLYPENLISVPDNPYAPDGMPSIAWSNYGELRNWKDIPPLGVTGALNTTLPVQAIKDLRRAYYSSVSWIDLQVGRVLNELEKLGLANNTIVSFFGDHGYQLGEHGEWCKHTNFELATHAPMMVHVPGMTDSGIVTEQLTELVDLFPTLVEAAGLPAVPLCPEDSANVPTCHEGMSLMRLIMYRSDAEWKQAAFSQYPRFKVKGQSIMAARPDNNEIVMGYTVRTNEYRYTEWVKFTEAPVFKIDWNTMYGVELYNHVIDPDENRNRADDPFYQTVRDRLSHQLRAGWRTQIPRQQTIVAIG